MSRTPATGRGEGRTMIAGRAPRRPSAVACVLLTVALSSLAAAAAATPPLQVDAQAADGVTLTLDTGELAWTARFDRDGTTYWEASLPGFATDGAPGRPRTPGYGAWLVLPPGTEPELTTLAAEWEALDGRAVAPGATPVWRDDPQGGKPILDERWLLPGEEPPAGERDATPPAVAGAGGGGPLVLGAPNEWRGHRIVSVSVRPLDVGADLHARRLLKRATWRVRFVPASGNAAATGRVVSRDARLGSLFLNGDRLGTDPRDAVPAAPRAKQALRRGTLLASEVRLPVTRTGLFRISASALIGAGLLPASGVSESQIRLYQRRYVGDQDPPYEEIEVPILMIGDGGDFSGDDAFVFYGLRPRDDLAFTSGGAPHPACDDTLEVWNPGAVDPVNNGNIYYLAAEEPPVGVTWSRMEETTLPAASGTPETSYRRQEHHEEDSDYFIRPADVFATRYMWNSKHDMEVVRPFDAVNPVPGDTVDLAVRLYGLGNTRTYTIELEHPDLSLEPLGTLSANESGATFTSTLLTGADLDGGSLRIANVSPLQMTGYIDWFELGYEALYEAQDDALDFNAGPDVGARSLVVGGFDSSEMRAFDISDPRAPLAVTLTSANVVDAGDGTWNLSLTAAQDAPGARRFAARAGALATAIPTLQTFKMSVVASTEDPVAAGDGVDVVVLTHRDFRDQADRWAQYRASHSALPLTVRVVDIYDVYDWYGGGLKSPLAVRRFVTRAKDRWGAWALQIFGDANENARTLTDGPNMRDFVPTHMHRWDDGSHYAEMIPSDKWYTHATAPADYPTSSAIPAEMLVGRFPCDTAAEATTMVDKVIAFESGEGAWKKRFIAVADDAWSDGYDVSASVMAYKTSEEAFENGEVAAADKWDGLAEPRDGFPGGAGFTSVRFLLSTYLEPLSPPHDQPRDRPTFMNYAEVQAVPFLLSDLSNSGMLVHYQGHANDHLLAHEQIFEDVRRNPSYRQDVASLGNVGRPFVFAGLACHISYWTRDASSQMQPTDWPSLGEKLMTRVGAGASAVYASPGYEYLSPNATLAQFEFSTLLDQPPRGGPAPAGRSRWLLGEVLLDSEARFLASNPSRWEYRYAVAQYCVLGDCLMNLDPGPPQLFVTQGWEPVANGATLKAAAADNLIVLTVNAFDEAGVDRLVVTGVDGATVERALPDGALSDQRTTFTVHLPVPDTDATAVLQVYDTAATGDDSPHASFTVHLPLSVMLYLDGAQFTAGETPLPAGPAAFTGRVYTAAYLPEDVALGLQGAGVELTDVTLSRTDEHTVDFIFTAEKSGTEPASLLLSIAGSVTEVPLEQAGPTRFTGISSLQAFPNPTSGGTRFLFGTDAAPADGRITVYSVAGHVVARIPVAGSNFQGGGVVIVNWDGRDDRGAPLANGVYMYRVELPSGGRTLTSDMQRLVMMK